MVHLSLSELIDSYNGKDLKPLSKRQEIILKNMVKKGDIAARDRLVMEGRKEISLAAWKYKGNSIERDPEDIAQDGFLRLLLGVSNYSGRRGASISTFAYSVAKNRALDLVKREKHRQTISLNDLDNDLKYNFSDNGMLGFEELISKIKNPLHREIFKLSFEEGLTNKEITNKISLKYNMKFGINYVQRTISSELKYLKLVIREPIFS